MNERPLFLVRFPAMEEREVLIYANNPSQALRVAMREIEADCYRPAPYEIVRLVGVGVMPIEAPRGKQRELPLDETPVVDAEFSERTGT